MKLWKYTPLDTAMALLSVGHFATAICLAALWERSSIPGRVGSFALLAAMMTYSIIVIAHLFTHTPWFQSQHLNALASMLNSINIGQSVQAYHLTHVRNHHRYNNDQKGQDGSTKDLSSTYRQGKDDQHATLFQYAFLGAVSTLANVGRDLGGVIRLWRAGPSEHELSELLSKEPEKRSEQLRQMQLDRIAHFLGMCLFVAISWKWTLLCYLPAFYLALVLVNIQNYYEHYGAAPENRYTDSVSYYGRAYNWLTFNDGYHQEHHLRPQTHWRSMPVVRRQHGDRLDAVNRVISPVPAILGFLDRNRRQLHRPSQSSTCTG